MAEDKQTNEPQDQNETPTQAPKSNNSKSSSGIEPNVAGLLAYVLGFVTGIIFLLIEKDNKFVKFHAMQSILFSVAVFVINFIVGSLVFSAMLGGATGIGLLGLLSTGLYIAYLVLWIMLMVKAYQNQEWELPIIGKIAKNYASK